MKSSAGKIQVTSFQDLFQTGGGTEPDDRTPREIPLSELFPFKNHPFQVRDDEAMQKTAESIARSGVLSPGIVRPRPEGGYEIIAGHRRKRGSELAGKDTMLVFVRELDDDEATIIMVDSNLQREKILPSEKAFAYKMKMEALKHQGKRSDLTLEPAVPKLPARDKIAQDAGENCGLTVTRYIALTKLIPPLLTLVDEDKNPNGLILGTPGSGKSFSAKREITNAFLITQDDIAVIDPEDEYSPLVRRLGGQVIDISPTSDQFINPMDLTLNYSEDDNPLTLKSDFILSLMELIVGGKAGLEPVEKTIVDRCVHMVYRDYLQDPRPDKMPVLGDLYKLLREQTEPEAQRLATALEIYVSGSLNVFNHRTNVEIKSRIVCYTIKKLGKQLKKFGMRPPSPPGGANAAGQSSRPVQRWQSIVSPAPRKSIFNSVRKAHGTDVPPPGKRHSR